MEVQETTQVIDCDPILLHDNPWQTHTRYDEAEIAALAESIDSIGLLQKPVGRQVINGTEKYIELAFGHSRARAFRKLNRLIPVEIRELSDEDMAKIAWAENHERKDVTAVEEARALQVMIDCFGWTQERIAEEVGLDRSTVANKLQLLKLPEDIQDQVVAGTLSERKAQAVLQFYKIPEADVELYLERGSQWATPVDELIKDALDPETSSDEVRKRYRQVQSQIDRFKEDVKREVKREKAFEKVRAKMDDPSQLVDVQNLNWDQYDRFYSHRPEGCSTDCPCARKAIGLDGEVVDICIDPKRLKKLRTTDSKDKNKGKRTKLRNTAKKVAERFAEFGLPPEHRSHALREIIMLRINTMRGDRIREAVKVMGLDSDAFDKVANSSAYHMHRDTARAAIATLSFDELLQFVYLSELFGEVQSGLGNVSYGTPSTPLCNAYLSLK